MSGNDEAAKLARARTDLVDMIRASPDDIEPLLEIIEGELKGIKEGTTSDNISEAVSKVAEVSGADADSVCNVLYWLTESGPDARQTIIVHTIESLLKDSYTRHIALAVLTRVSSQDNIDIMMKYVDRGVLTLSQAIFVLLYPDSAQLFDE
ncbi:MAG: hypothetical protein K9W43_05755 [Candidatus Thorarchaeota archaeon]|nr:hypothetical protein [Candidatus Thorarchaeota archaeon]